MTKEEVIRIAQGLVTDFKCESDTVVDFCNTIIRALKQEPCEDAVSRTEVMKAIEEVGLLTCEYVDVKQAIESLPPIQLKPKIGHWVNLEDTYGDIVESVCSNCGHNGNYKWNFCPNCGTEMRDER